MFSMVSALTLVGARKMYKLLFQNSHVGDCNFLVKSVLQFQKKADGLKTLAMLVKS